MSKTWILAAGALLAMTAVAQDDKVTIPFRDPGGAKKVTITLMQGGMTVKGYDGREVQIEASGRGSIRSSSRRPSGVTDGMKRIDSNASGLEITEENNIIKIDGGVMRPVSLTVMVPRQTSLVLRTMNGGVIAVENVAGEIDASNMNGAVTITNVSGSVLANSQNGKITVSLDKVIADKAMSFTTYNGTVDVTLPGDVRARLKMKTDNGEIWSDFDIKLDANNRPPVVEDTRGKNGKYKVHLDKAMYGTINGGGPEMQFVTFNGNIVIHKK